VGLQVDELAHSNTGLAENCRERPSSELTVHWDNNRSTFVIAKFHVAPSLTDLCKANLRERSHDLLTGNNR
jgi:hypothetical protein